MTKQAILDNKKIDDTMKNFKVRPYSETEAVLDEYHRKTVEFVKNLETKNKKDDSPSVE